MSDSEVLKVIDQLAGAMNRDNVDVLVDVLSHTPIPILDKIASAVAAGKRSKIDQAMLDAIIKVGYEAIEHTVEIESLSSRLQALEGNQLDLVSSGRLAIGYVKFCPAGLVTIEGTQGASSITDNGAEDFSINLTDKVVDDIILSEPTAIGEGSVSIVDTEGSAIHLRVTGTPESVHLSWVVKE